MSIQQHEIDAQIESATQTKARYGYTTQAVVVKSWAAGGIRPHLGFFFENGHKVGEIGRHEGGANFEVLAIV